MAKDETPEQPAPPAPPEKRKKSHEPPAPPTHYCFVVTALGSYSAGSVVSAEDLGEAEIARYSALGAIVPVDVSSEDAE